MAVDRPNQLHNAERGPRLVRPLRPRQRSSLLASHDTPRRAVGSGFVDRDALLRLVEAYRDAWVGHDLDGLVKLVTSDVVFHNYTAGERVEGADRFREHVAQIHARWSDTQFRERRVYLGDDFAAVEWTATATRADGDQIEWDGCDLIALRGDRICGNSVYSSSHAPRVMNAAPH